MATNTKQARRQAERRRQDIAEVYENEFRSLFHNSVTVENLPEDLPKRYLLRTLLNKGGIAYDKETGLYLPFVDSGIDAYGEPTAYNLIGANGLTLWRATDEVVILRANDLAYPPIKYIEQIVDKLVEFDMTIFQNLDAVKTMTIMEVKDRDTLLTLGNVAETRQIGATLAVVNSSANLGETLNASSTGAQYLVDKLMQGRLEVFNEGYAHVGTATSNTDKAERVQSIEVTASQGKALDMISTLIDTFNHDAEVGGISIRLKGNTSLVEDRDLEVEEKENQDKGIENNVEL